MKLLLDSAPLTYRLLTEKQFKDDRGRVTVIGKFQHAGVGNRNKRIYPRRVWEQHLKEGAEFIERIRGGSVFGHLEHPENGRSDVRQCAFVIQKLWMEASGEIWGQLRTTTNTHGRDLAALFEDGIALGISSRGNGSVIQKDGLDEVQDDFVPVSFDIVADPSTPGAELRLKEGKFRVSALAENLGGDAAKISEFLKKEDARTRVEETLTLLEDTCYIDTETVHIYLKRCDLGSMPTDYFGAELQKRLGTPVRGSYCRTDESYYDFAFSNARKKYTAGELQAILVEMNAALGCSIGESSADLAITEPPPVPENATGNTKELTTPTAVALIRGSLPKEARPVAEAVCKRLQTLREEVAKDLDEKDRPKLIERADRLEKYLKEEDEPDEDEPDEDEDEDEEDEEKPTEEATGTSAKLTEVTAAISQIRKTDAGDTYIIDMNMDAHESAQRLVRLFNSPKRYPNAVAATLINPDEKQTKGVRVHWKSSIEEFQKAMVDAGFPLDSGSAKAPDVAAMTERVDVVGEQRLTQVIKTPLLEYTLALSPINKAILTLPTPDEFRQGQWRTDKDSVGRRYDYWGRALTHVVGRLFGVLGPPWVDTTPQIQEPKGGGGGIVRVVWNPMPGLSPDERIAIDKNKTAQQIIASSGRQWPPQRDLGFWGEIKALFQKMTGETLEPPKGALAESFSTFIKSTKVHTAVEMMRDANTTRIWDDFRAMFALDRSGVVGRPDLSAEIRQRIHLLVSEIGGAHLYKTLTIADLFSIQSTKAGTGEAFFHSVDLSAETADEKMRLLRELNKSQQSPASAVLKASTDAKSDLTVKVVLNTAGTRWLEDWLREHRFDQPVVVKKPEGETKNPAVKVERYHGKSPLAAKPMHWTPKVLAETPTAPVSSEEDPMLAEQNRRLRAEVDRLTAENKHLTNLVTEMTRVQKVQALKERREALIAQNPALKDAVALLEKCATIDDLNDTARAFTTALAGSQSGRTTQTENVAPKPPVVPTGGPEAQPKNGVPSPRTLQEGSDSTKGNTGTAGKPVSGKGALITEDTEDRLAAYFKARRS